MANWTQAICALCYAVRQPGRDPVRLKEPAREKCCDCGHITRDGIYFRVDPAIVKYPRPDFDE